MGISVKEGNMIDHVSIGVRDIAKAKAFYDAASSRSATLV
jgi:catechol 2,3-dioxygenase-like lactoylglutathione lyase family enzyme